MIFIICLLIDSKNKADYGSVSIALIVHQDRKKEPQTNQSLKIEINKLNIFYFLILLKRAAINIALVIIAKILRIVTENQRISSHVK